MLPCPQPLAVTQHIVSNHLNGRGHAHWLLHNHLYNYGQVAQKLLAVTSNNPCSIDVHSPVLQLPAAVCHTTARKLQHTHSLQALHSCGDGAGGQLLAAAEVKLPQGTKATHVLEADPRHLAQVELGELHQR